MKLKLAVTVMLLALLIFGAWGTPIAAPNATADFDAVKEPFRNSVLSDGDIVQMTISVLEEEGVVNYSPDTNYHSSVGGGGLFVGLEPHDTAVARGWLKFNLTHVPKEAAIQSATLYSHLNSEYLVWDDEDAPIGVYYSSNDSWLETAITWNNQPSFEDTPSDFIDSPASPDMFDPQNWYGWDVTADVSTTLAGDKILTEVLRNVDESASVSCWKYFTEDEYYHFNASYLALEYTTPEMASLAVDGHSTSPLKDYIQGSTPTISWSVTDPDTNEFQRDYEVEVWSNEHFNDTNLWRQSHTNITTIHDGGTSINTHPFARDDEVRLQMKFPSSIISRSGIVDKLYFNAAVDDGTTVLENFQVYMLNLDSDTDLTTNFEANYGGKTPVQVLSREVYETSVVDGLFVVDIENTFMCSIDMALLIEFRLTNNTGDLIRLRLTSSGGPGSSAAVTGPGAYTETTAIYALQRTYDLKLGIATTDTLYSTGVFGNAYPFGVDPGTPGVFQLKYNKSLIADSGTIDKLYFRTLDTDEIVYENFTVYLVETPRLEGLSTTPSENYGGVTPTKVLEAEEYVVHNLGLCLVIDIDNIFHYNNENDLLVELRWDALISGNARIRFTMNAGSYRMWNLTLAGPAVGNDASTYDMLFDFVHSENAIEYAGTALVNATEYYVRARTSDSTGIWTSWSELEFKYEELTSTPEWEGPVAIPDPITLGNEVEVSINATYFLGIDAVLIEYGGSNYTMLGTGDTYTYAWTPTAAGNVTYVIYMESEIGTWSTASGVFEVLPASLLPPGDYMLYIIIGAGAVVLVVVLVVVRKKRAASSGRKK
jgi:hypothetical protein